MSASIRYLTYYSFRTDYAPHIRSSDFYYVFHSTSGSDVAPLFLCGAIEDVLQKLAGHSEKRWTHAAIFSRHRDACRYYGTLQGRARASKQETPRPTVGSPESPTDPPDHPHRMKRMRLHTLVRGAHSSLSKD